MASTRAHTRSKLAKTIWATQKVDEKVTLCADPDRQTCAKANWIVSPMVCLFQYLFLCEVIAFYLNKDKSQLLAGVIKRRRVLCFKSLSLSVCVSELIVETWWNVEEFRVKTQRLKIVGKLGRAPSDSPSCRGVTLTKVVNVTRTTAILWHTSAIRSYNIDD